jgi:hypothetical protein
MVSTEEAHLARQGTAVDVDDAQPWLIGFDELDLNEELAGERLRVALSRLEVQPDAKPSEIPTVRSAPAPVRESKASEIPTVSPAATGPGPLATPKASEIPTVRPEIVTSPDQIRSDKAAPSRFIRSDDQISDLIETLRAWLPDKEWKMPQQSWWLKVIQEHPDALREELERAKLYALSVVRTEREIPDADRGRYLTSKINKRCYPKPKGFCPATWSATYPS